MFLAMPAPMQIYGAVQGDEDCPVTVREGRLWLSNYANNHMLKDIPEEAVYSPLGFTPVVELEDIWFKYGKDQLDVLRGLSLKAYRGEFLAVVGSNGVGKTTMLSIISGLNRPYRGRVILEGRELSEHKSPYRGLLGVLPQNPQSLFVKKTVREDLLEMLESPSLSISERDKKIAHVSRLCRLEELLDRHPYDLSGASSSGGPGEDITSGAPDTAHGRAHKGSGRRVQTGAGRHTPKPSAPRRDGYHGEP